MKKSEFCILSIVVSLMKSGEFQFSPSVVGAGCLNVLMDGQTPRDKLNPGFTPLTFIVQIIRTDFQKMWSILQRHYKLKGTHCINS